MRSIFFAVNGVPTNLPVNGADSVSFGMSFPDLHNPNNKGEMMVKKILLMVLGGMFLAGVAGSPVFAEDAECPPLGKDNEVKVEGYISKKFKKDQKKIFQEFAEIGNVRTVLRTFPMGDTAKVVAIGKCVPAYIARHILEKTLLYTSGVGSLVQQAFLSPLWVGIGVTIFDEPSQQTVTEEQVKQMLNPALGDEEFHVLYRKFSVQDELVPYFGLERPNAKIPQQDGGKD